MMKKPHITEEIGVPISRNGSTLGLKSQNGCIPPKLPSGSPSPKLSQTPTHMPTILDDPGKKVKKPAPPQHFSPRTAQELPGTSNSNSSRSGSQRQGSWDSRDVVLSTSPKLLATATANGHGLKGNDESAGLDRRGSSSSSPEHSASSDSTKAPQTPRSGAAHLCGSQETNCSTAGPSKTPPSGADSKTVKLKSPVLSNTTTEPASTMSPPPAKKLALSAKKVGVWGSRRCCVSGELQALLGCGLKGVRTLSRGFGLPHVRGTKCLLVIPSHLQLKNGYLGVKAVWGVERALIW